MPFMSAPSAIPGPSTADLAQVLRTYAPLTQPEAESFFDALPAVDPAFLLGHWAAGFVNVTSEPAQRTTEKLRAMGWVGKRFHSTEHVEPLIVMGEGGARSTGCTARLREVKARGVVTAGMIYDDVPIIDFFRRVTDDVVLGMMDHKDAQYPPNYMFFLERLK